MSSLQDILLARDAAIERTLPLVPSPSHLILTSLLLQWLQEDGGLESAAAHQETPLRFNVCGPVRTLSIALRLAECEDSSDDEDATIFVTVFGDSIHTSLLHRGVQDTVRFHCPNKLISSLDNLREFLGADSLFSWRTRIRAGLLTRLLNPALDTHVAAFDTLGDDIITTVLSFVDVKDVCAVDRSFRGARRAVDSEHLWRILLRRWRERRGSSRVDASRSSVPGASDEYCASRKLFKEEAEAAARARAPLARPGLFALEPDDDAELMRRARQRFEDDFRIRSPGRPRTHWPDWY